MVVVRDSWFVVRGSWFAVRSLYQHALNGLRDRVVWNKLTRGVQQNCKFLRIVSVFCRIGQISQCTAKRQLITVFQFLFPMGKFKDLMENGLGLLLITRGLRL